MNDGPYLARAAQSERLAALLADIATAANVRSGDPFVAATVRVMHAVTAPAIDTAIGEIERGTLARDLVAIVPAALAWAQVNVLACFVEPNARAATFEDAAARFADASRHFASLIESETQKPPDRTASASAPS